MNNNCSYLNCVYLLRRLLKYKWIHLSTFIIDADLILQLSYASELAPLDERTAFPGFYQNSPSFAAAIESLNSLMKHFRWNRIALFTEDELRFTRVRLK